MKSGKRKNITQPDMTLAELLRQLRVDAGYKQKDIAKILGIKPVTCSAYESGRIAPTTEKLVMLAKLYGVDLTLFTEKLGVAGTEDADFFQNEPASSMFQTEEQAGLLTDAADAKEMKHLKELDEYRDYIAKADELLYYFKNLSVNQRDMVFDLVKALYLDKRA